MSELSKISLETKWDKEAAREVIRNLVAYNNQHVAEADQNGAEENFSLVLRDESNQIVGGIVAHLFWHRLKIEIFWVDEQMRGRGWGSRLLQEMEAIAKEKGARLIELDTFSFQAPEFYQKQGYQKFGQVDNFPTGHTHYHFIKRL
ncbi:GNAT family N-acetyltransferase [Tumebacillus lipolyticus]|uniref:GNAT family N-acetyltransferase n=1 Tax=Tumebacillus lipolyticus TaxID=1280370 RepID=A0ABW4ZVM5_9BACL